MRAGDGSGDGTDDGTGNAAGDAGLGWGPGMGAGRAGVPRLAGRAGSGRRLCSAAAAMIRSGEGWRRPGGLSRFRHGIGRGVR